MEAALKNVAKSTKGVSLGQDAWRRLRRDRRAMAALCSLLLIALLAFFAPLLPLQPPDRENTQLPNDLQYDPPKRSPLVDESLNLDWESIQRTPELVAAAPPELADDIVMRPYRAAGFPEIGTLSRWMVRMRYHIFGDWSVGSICGRDELGRDLLSRLFWGARISLVVGLVATFVSLTIGVSYGAIAGYAGGWLDEAMMRVVDVLYSVPFIFVVIYIVTILSDLQTQLDQWGISRITIFYLVVGAIYWLTMSRVVRGQVVSLKNEPFIEAARAVGAGHGRIIVMHILPNLLSIVIVYLTLTIPQVMLFEAFLSFLGLGVQPPDVSWGGLANEGIKVMTPIKVYWWLIVYPSLALGVTLFALNVLGDGLRDALDPKLASR